MLVSAKNYLREVPGRERTFTHCISEIIWWTEHFVESTAPVLSIKVMFRIVKSIHEISKVKERGE